MSKTWSVLKTEFINTVTRRSFIIVLILVPLVPALILGGISLFTDDDVESPGIDIDFDGDFLPIPDSEIQDGFVDQAGIISDIPIWIDEGRLVPFATESKAREAVLADEIQGFFVIHPDYLETGQVTYYRDDFNPMAVFDNTWVINTTLRYNLLGADMNRFETFEMPLHVQWVDLTPEEEPEVDPSNMAVFYIPYGMTMLFYFLIVSSASMMMNNVAKEKENRVMEILMSSIKPKQLLTGKILGLGLVGLLQLTVWLGSAYILLRLGGTTLNIPPALQPSPVVLVWSVIFFIFGYLVYATLMAGVGALVPNLKEATQATFLIIFPMLIPLFLIGVIINQPNATLSVVLSLFPLTAPNTMMTRIAAVTVPLWQILLSIILLAITVFLLIRAVAGMFRAQLLLTGKKFSLGLLIRALLGKDLE
jgi:ABC-2 type transport system permease protein